MPSASYSGPPIDLAARRDDARTAAPEHVDAVRGAGAGSRRGTRRPGCTAARSRRTRRPRSRCGASRRSSRRCRRRSARARSAVRPRRPRHRASGIRFSQQISPPTRPTPGRSTTPRSSPAPTPWNTRSCIVGISLRWRCRTPLGTDDEQRVVQRAGAVVLAFVHADRDVHVVLGAGLDQPIDERSADVDARRPHPLPQLVAARRDQVAAGRRPRAARVERDEALGEHDELGALVGGLVEQRDRLVDRRLGVEDHRSRLHRRDPHRVERRHPRRLSLRDHLDPPAGDSTEIPEWQVREVRRCRQRLASTQPRVVPDQPDTRASTRMRQ